MPAEQRNADALNSAKYKRRQAQGISHKLRGSLLRPQQLDTDETPEEAQSEHTHKRNLSRLKFGATVAKNKADKRLGELAGEIGGGFLGSIIPFLGTTAGAFLGRYIGRKKGLSGIIIACMIFLIITTLLWVITFLILFKGYCDLTGIWDRSITGICKEIR